MFSNLYMIPLEILLPSLCLNLVYLLIRIIENKEKYKNFYRRLINSKNKLEISIHTYNNSLTELQEDHEHYLIEFIETLQDLNKIINFNTI